MQQMPIPSTSAVTHHLLCSYAPMNDLLNEGLIESILDDEVIWVAMEIDPIFSSMPIELLSTTIIKVGWLYTNGMS